MGDKQNKPQVGKLTFLKALIGKVILGQIACGFTIITP